MPAMYSPQDFIRESIHRMRERAQSADLSDKVA
jgi:hypothetical protein